MSDDAARVYTIPAGIAFADALARGLLGRAAGDPLALAAMTILLPTRRSARALSDAFLRVAEGRALLLPRMLALADIDGDVDAIGGAALPPAFDRLDRKLILARLVMKTGRAATPDQGLRLAGALTDLIDEVETEQADFAKLAELAPEEFAEHWQQILDFLKIVTAAWPAILAENRVVDPAARRRLALEARTISWKTKAPGEPVIAAGFITADPALADLIGTICRLPEGMAVLPGLDRDLDNEAWDEIETTHPQFGMKTLLERIGVPRGAVSIWPQASDAATELRTKLFSGALRPAATTEQWRGGKVAPESLAGLVRLDCPTIGDEAESIALAMRETLETPGRTAALVTPDRALARRVAGTLRRWNIEIDDSAGRPLSETPVGIWLRLMAEAVADHFPPRALLSLLKHPLAACGLETETLRVHVRALERAVLRGPRPIPGLEGLQRTLHGTRDSAFDGGGKEKAAIEAWLDDLAARLDPLVAAMRSGSKSLAEFARCHGEAAEALAETPRETGALRLWRGQDGEAAAELLNRLGSIAADTFPAIRADSYPALLDALMADIVVRPLYGAHPRLAIWGLIEARLQHADLMILGGLNEGSWPPLPGEEPWMSRPMRARFGLKPRETEIGLAAQDFVLAAAAPNVLLTRALRVDGAPTVPARFLSRLDAFLAGSGLAIPQADQWRYWSHALDRPGHIAPRKPPAPRPPLTARPRELSVTAVERWMRDPYALYAEKILKLRALDPIDADPGAAERGNFIHAALDLFLGAHLEKLPADAFERLKEAGRAAFGEALRHPAVAAFWWPRFERIAHWFLAWEQARRGDGTWPLATEQSGYLKIAASAGPFRLTAKADRIDRLPDGRFAILDYKTGRVPKAGALAEGYAPQLPLEALIAREGAFGTLPQAETGELGFVRLTGGNPAGEWRGIANADLTRLIDNARQGLLRLIAAFDDPSTPYYSRPHGAFDAPGDYDHLARVKEWSETEA